MKKKKKKKKNFLNVWFSITILCVFCSINLTAIAVFDCSSVETKTWIYDSFCFVWLLRICRKMKEIKYYRFDFSLLNYVVCDIDLTMIHCSIVYLCKQNLDCDSKCHVFSCYEIARKWKKLKFLIFDFPLLNCLICGITLTVILLFDCVPVETKLRFLIASAMFGCWERN